MTVTKDISLLCAFKTKIDEAASYVPRMHPADKLKAVQFWNLVSDKLQSIVYCSSSDINLVAVKTTENEFEKMHLDTNSSRPNNVIANCSISSDFINLPPNYGINSEIMEQYHSVDIDNPQLLTSDAFSIVTESSLNNISSISQFNPLTSSLNSCERNITDNYIAVENLPENKCDTLALNSCVSAASRVVESVLEESITDSDYITKEVADHEGNLCKPSEVTEDVSNHVPSVSDDTDLMNDKMPDKNDDTKFSVLKLPCDKSNNQADCGDHETNVSEDSESSKGSVKSDLDTIISTEDSNSSRSEHIEPIVSFSSCSKEILSKNGLTPEVNEKCSEDCIGRKCLHLKPYVCSICSAKFSSKGNLIVHVRKHTGEKPYSCPKCSSSFTTKGNLKRHLKTHTGEKPFQCSHCGSKFTEKKSLNVHMRRHTGEKPYECKDCGKRFAQSGILHTHRAMHLNQKFHLCEHCGKSFRQRSQLHIHKLRHENIRKHGCSMCSSRFLTKGDLERHMRVHTGERPFVCNICSKKYTRQQSLNEHMNRHYGLRPYVCKYCSRTFTEMSACYKHVKQHEKTAAESSENSQAESSSEHIKQSTKVAVATSAKSQTECSSQPSKLSERASQIVSHSSSVEIIRLSKSESNEPPPKDESVDTNETIIATYIENFIV